MTFDGAIWGNITITNILHMSFKGQVVLGNFYLDSQQTGIPIFEKKCFAVFLFLYCNATVLLNLSIGCHKQSTAVKIKKTTVLILPRRMHRKKINSFYTPDVTL